MSELTRPERDCANVVIGEIIKGWDTLRDGDLVALMLRVNALVALSVAAQRCGNKEIAG